MKPKRSHGADGGVGGRGDEAQLGYLLVSSFAFGALLGFAEVPPGRLLTSVECWGKENKDEKHDFARFAFLSGLCRRSAPAQSSLRVRPKGEVGKAELR